MKIGLFEFRRLVMFGLGPLVLFVVNMVFVFTGAYQIFLPLDDVMHVLGGVVMAKFVVDGVGVLEPGFFGQKNSRWLSGLCVLGLVSLIAVVWEFAEFGVDYFWSVGLQQGLADTLMDLALGWVGGVVGIVILGGGRDSF